MKLDLVIDLSPLTLLEAAVEEYEAAGAEFQALASERDRLDGRMRAILREAAPLKREVLAAIAKLDEDDDSEAAP